MVEKYERRGGRSLVRSLTEVSLVQDVQSSLTSFLRMCTLGIKAKKGPSLYSIFVAFARTTLAGGCLLACVLSTCSASPLRCWSTGRNLRHGSSAHDMPIYAPKVIYMLPSSGHHSKLRQNPLKQPFPLNNRAPKKVHISVDWALIANKERLSILLWSLQYPGAHRCGLVEFDLEALRLHAG